MAANTSSQTRKLWGTKHIVTRYRNLGLSALLVLFTLLLLLGYLSPFGYMGVTSVKNKPQITQKSLLPLAPVVYQYEGEEYPEWSVLTGTKYPLYNVPAEDGTMRELALIRELDDRIILLDPTKPQEEGVIEQQGTLADLEPIVEPVTHLYVGTSYADEGVVRGTEYPIYEVPLDASTQELALFKSESGTHYFLNPADPESGIVTWDGNLENATALVEPVTYTHRGKRIPEVVLQPGAEYPLYEVPDPDGGMQRWAMVREGVGNVETYFIDPDNLDAGILAWSEQPFAGEQSPSANPVRQFDPQLENFEEAWDEVNFPRHIYNTFMIAVLGVIGTVVSCILVAYAFTRFPLPFKNVLFMVLMSTIILPKQVTLVPTYFVFAQVLGWTGTWLPLIVPHFFANAYNVLLLRQYFRTLPMELDEAAMIDGAGPLRILVSIIIPQSWPAIVAVSLFHFVFAWNDYFEPLIYTLSNPDIAPISVAIQQFNFVFDQQPHLIQATALMALIPPVVLFFMAQRVFMRGVVMTGVDK